MKINKAELDILTWELVSDSIFYGHFYPILQELARYKTEAKYTCARNKLQCHTNTIKSLSLEDRSYLMEKLFYHYYEDLFGVGDIENRDLLHKVKPGFHESVFMRGKASVVAPCNEIPQPTKEKEEIKMSSIDNQKAVQIVTYVYGNDTAEMKDSDYYAVIRGLEKDIKNLDGIENKPKKLIAAIAEKQAAIQSIVALMDSKE